MPEDMESLLTKKEVAKYFNKSVRTIEKWVEDGDLKCCPKAPKNTWLFNPDYIRSFGEMGFRCGVSSPELYKLKKKYERDIKEKDQEIVKLKSIIREFYIQGLKAVNIIQDCI